MTDQLEKVELAEANSLLRDFRADSSLSGILFLLGFVCLFFAPIFFIFGWPSKAFVSAAITLIMWAIAAYKSVQSRFHFTNMRSKFIKLQQAGYQLRIVGKVNPLIEISSIHSVGGGTPVDFNSITHKSRILDEGA
ncbi:MAG: hypothetical protein QM769_05225 [Pseudoxanthomonas sp.]